MESVKEIVVKEKDIDELGHVNNSVYLVYLEEGREDWYINASGASFEDMRKKNLGTVILRIDILFKKEVVLGDSLRVITNPKKLGNTSYVFEQKIVNDQDEEICQATITNVMLDLETRSSILVIDSIARNFK